MAMRIKIHKDGTATLSGVPYETLRSILTEASLYRFDQDKAANVRAEEGEMASVIRQNKLADRAWRDGMRKSIDALEKAMRAAIDATHPQRGPHTVKGRMADVLERRRFRQNFETWLREHSDTREVVTAESN